MYHGHLRHRATLSAIRRRAAPPAESHRQVEGCYHGHGDSFLVKAGSGALTFGVPTSPGVPKALADLTLTLSYNDFDAATALFHECGGDIAGLIIEPVVGNANCLPPRDGFLQHLRTLCTQHGALLIFDEVMTGFRVAPGGAQARYGVTPDLSTFGKIIGGGMPVGAYGGRRELMEQIAPSGPIYQAGTLSGNPVAMAAGLAMLDLVAQPGFHEGLEAKTNALCDGLETAAREAGVAFTTQRVGGMFGMFFTDEVVDTYRRHWPATSLRSPCSSTPCAGAACTWRLRVRGWLHVGRARRCGDRADHRCSAPGIRDRASRLNHAAGSGSMPYPHHLPEQPNNAT